MANSNQSDVIALLRDPATHGDPPDGVEVIETHAAMVFLAGDRAFKIKKAVRLPYLDFSTLEKRRRACEREIEINKPTAPDIYLAAEPVTRGSGGRLGIGGDGETVEWLVVMNRFAGNAILGNPDKTKALEGPFLDMLADTVADLHARAAKGPRDGGAMRIGAVANGILASLSEAPDLVSPPLRDALENSVGRGLAATCRVLDFRAWIGQVRRCHGDLHLGNIVDIGGRPVPFDSLEFDEELATVDTLYDLAFLLTDLEERGMRAAACRILNRYLVRAGSLANYYGLAALPLFMACRVMIRVRVLIDRLRQQPEPVDPEMRRHIETQLGDALGLLQEDPPVLVAIGGLSGTGKTTLARDIAPLLGRAPGALLIRSDVERKALAGVAETEWLPAETYTPDSARRVYARMLRKTRLGLGAGQSVVVDAVHLKAGERRAVEAAAAAVGAPFRGIWLRAGGERLVERVERRNRERRDASDATAEVVRRQLIRDPGPLDWTAIDASGEPSRTLEAAVEAVADIRA